MESLKAGYVSFGTMFYEPKRLKEISTRAEKQLEAVGIELIKTDPVFGEGEEPNRAIRELKTKDWDFLHQLDRSPGSDPRAIGVSG